MRRSSSFLALAILACAAQAQTPTKYPNEKAITAGRLKAHLEFIANDLLEGRDTPSRGLDIATWYVATQLKLWGAQPAGDNGTFFQQVPMTRRTLDTDQSSIEVGGKTFTFGEGFKAATRGCIASGKLVYIGHGFMIKKKGIDPYAGLDLKGKILVAASGLPPGVQYQDMQGTPGVDYMWASFAAKKYGALGVLSMSDLGYLKRWTPEMGKSMGGISLGGESEPEVGAPEVNVGPSLADALFAGEPISAQEAFSGNKAPDKPFEFSKSVNIKVVEQKITLVASNVVAIVPGSDPKLKSEYVAFGAHIDHVGIMPNATGDKIFNGADDDGSGTVAVLEIAHALLTGPRPKRSALFVWHVGEEKGLWGSDYFTTHPTVDLKKVVAQLNIDMIGRSRPAGDKNPANNVLTGPNEIYVVGSTKMSTDLQKMSETVNSGFLKLGFNYKYDDPKDQEAIFYRSDHFNYARKGIPIIFYFDGVHEDYHQPGDEVSKIDFQKMSKVTKSVYALGWAMGNGKRPVVDKPLKLD